VYSWLHLHQKKSGHLGAPNQNGSPEKKGELRLDQPLQPIGDNDKALEEVTTHLKYPSANLPATKVPPVTRDVGTFAIDKLEPDRQLSEGDDNQVG
jgi:hypothetical protein